MLKLPEAEVRDCWKQGNPVQIYSEPGFPALSARCGLMEAVRHLPSILCTSARSMTFTGPWLSAMEYALAASSMYTARV